MKLFNIEYGVGGGYNVIHNEEIEADSLDQANEMAYQYAIEVFDSYSVFDRQDNEGNYETEDDYLTAYNESVERWCRYHAEEVE
jgi:hypothetical protein